jgi:hypothetical protein
MHRVTIVCVLATIPIFGDVVSDFSINDEGWQDGNFDTSTASPTPVIYLSSGGNPGGQIEIADNEVNNNFSWNAFLAPAKFLGNQSSEYNGELSFDLYDTFVNLSGDTQPLVMISDGTNFLFSPMVLNASVLGPPFHHFSVRFVAATGWSTSPFGGSPVSEALMKSVMSNLQILAIDADWQLPGVSFTFLDNVDLKPIATPEPSTIGLLGIILSGFFVTRLAFAKSR